MRQVGRRDDIFNGSNIHPYTSIPIYEERIVYLEEKIKELRSIVQLLLNEISSEKTKIGFQQELKESKEVIEISQPDHTVTPLY